MKKKSKVSAEFNMSSLTDIIFLLLIFFMLTSSMVVPNALNLKLPGRSADNKTEVTTKPFRVDIRKDGKFYLDGKRINASNLEKQIVDLKKRRRGKEVSMVIAANPDADNDFVVQVMDMAYRYGVTAIMTTN